MSIRVYDLAKSLGVNNKEILDILHEIGVDGKVPSSGLPEDLAERVRGAMAKKRAPGKPGSPGRPGATGRPDTAERPPVTQTPHVPERPSVTQTPHVPERPPVTQTPHVPERPSVTQPAHVPGKPSVTQPAYVHGKPPVGQNSYVHGKPPVGQNSHGHGKPPEAKPPAAPHSAPHVTAPRAAAPHGAAPHGAAPHGSAPQARPPVRPPHPLNRRDRYDKKKPPVVKPPQAAAVKPPAAVPSEEHEEVIIPDRFKKEITIDKVEKLKPKVSMQRAFQSVRKVEQKKLFDPRASGKKGSRFGGRSKGAPSKQTAAVTAPRRKVIKLQEGTSVSEFAMTIGQKISDVIKKFIELGFMPNINQAVDMEAAVLVADAYGVKVEAAMVEDIDVVDSQEDVELLAPRPPVITVMGHVDHGKTSLLDAIRQTNVAESEAGGITQHIGAYKVKLKGKEIVFLDTPGHEAFTAMRARGAKVTDIVVLVVAADDGVMPQTVEAINHATAAQVPIVVAVNKIDKPGADIARVRKELGDRQVVPEEWGGKNIFVEVSAKKRLGINELLEMILLQADMMELKANPDRRARGIIIESKVDKGRGIVATILIQSGTLRIGDSFIAGLNFGRVRALVDDLGRRIQEAGPSTPVEVIGFSDVPNSGEIFTVVEDEKKARLIVLDRRQKTQAVVNAVPRKLNLEELHARIREQEIKELNIIIKADVQGSLEAIRGSLEGIKHAEVKVRVIHISVGGVNESDVMLAAASNAIIIGFNVRAEVKAAKLAEREGVDIRFYTVIYEIINNIKQALEGMLTPSLKEVVLGTAEVRNTFVISKIGTVAGCYVTEGTIQRASEGVRIIRDNIVIYTGKISSLKRIKDDASEVNKGYECGILIENFNDIKVGDVFENFKIEKIAGKL